MAYYIRVLSLSNAPVSVEELRAAVAKADEVAKITELQPRGDGRQVFEVSAESGEVVLQLERDPVEPDSMGEHEVQEFLAEIKQAKPASAVDWLASYLPRVKTIWALQLFGDESFRPIVDAVRGFLWNAAPAILQADHEGFTNEDGYHILWQFSERVSGPWWMAVLDQGKWRRFRMELGNHGHRKEFWEGRVPAGL